MEAFANQIALAIERAQLAEVAHQQQYQRSVQPPPGESLQEDSSDIEVPVS